MSEKRRLLTIDQEVLIVEAIRAAERGSRGEVRVHVESHCKDPLARAERLYRVLGLDRTEEDTGVLLYVAVDDRRAAVFAGAGIHDATSPATWQAAVDAVVRGFERGQPAAGFVEALGKVGDVLRERAPGPDLAGDELKDRITGPEDDPDRVESRERIGMDDMRDLVSVATDIRRADDDELTREDLLEIAGELGLSDTDLEAARVELERRRAAEREAEAERARLRRRALIASGVVVALAVLSSLVVQRGMSRSLAEVERHRAQVRNVVERQQDVRARVASLPAGDPERQAELAGAENRVSVERRRHDEAATRYNARAGGLPGRVVATLFGMPTRVPLSAERDES